MIFDKRYCENQTAKVGTLEKDFAVLCERFEETDKKIDRISDMISSMQERDIKLDKSVEKINANLDTLSEKVNNIDNRVSKLEDNSTFNIDAFIKSKFVAICLIAGAVAFYLSKIGII